jgi:hypothetical protein
MAALIAIDIAIAVLVCACLWFLIKQVLPVVFFTIVSLCSQPLRLFEKTAIASQNQKLPRKSGATRVADAVVLKAETDVSPDFWKETNWSQYDAPAYLRSGKLVC